MARSTIAQQIAEEYSEGQNVLSSKKLRQVKQLVLMNNLRRGEQNIASTTLLTFFYRVFANLYDDHIGIKLGASEDSDYKRTEVLSKLQQFDYKEMDKALLDYDWLWDTLFFGRGYCETLVFDKERKIMMPEVINPLMMVYDPYFADPQKWRYYGNWILVAGHEIERMIRDGVITGIKSTREIQSGVEPEMWQYKVLRDQAKDAAPATNDVANNANGIFQIYRTFRYHNGKKYIQWTDKNFSKTLRSKPLELHDGKRAGESKWPIVVKEVFREPHSTLATSIPDIVEDKHRALNVLYNLIYMAAKDEANPIYIYDVDKVQDVSQLLQRQILQHIPVSGDVDKAVTTLKTQNAMSQSLMSFIGVLKQEAAEVAGTTQTTLPAGKGSKKSATADAILQQIAELMGSLQAKVLAIGEREFWSHWYQRYINPDNIEAGDTKVISITSVSGESFENIKLDEIKTKYPPRIEVSSSKEAEFKQMIAKREAMQYFPLIQKIKEMSQKGLMNYLKYVFLPMFIKDSSTIELIIPNTLDEIKAQQENDMLAEDKLPDISPDDDHEQHMYTHLRSKRTAAFWAHWFTHEKMLGDKLKQEEAQRALMAASGGGQSGDGSDDGGDSGPPNSKKKGNTQGDKKPKTKVPSREDAAAPIKEAANKIMASAAAPR